MARTAGDVVLLDSIVRNNGFNTTGNGAVATAVPCAVTVNSSLSLRGLRLGLPSTLGWVPSDTYDGISGEVSISDAAVVLVPLVTSATDASAVGSQPAVVAHCSTPPGMHLVLKSDPTGSQAQCICASDAEGTGAAVRLYDVKKKFGSLDSTRLLLHL